MSVATPLPRAARPSAQLPGPAPSASTPASRAEPRDRTVIVALAVCFAAIAALTWRKWGVPEIDAGGFSRVDSTVEFCAGGNRRVGPRQRVRFADAELVRARVQDSASGLRLRGARAQVLGLKEGGS